MEVKLETWQSLSILSILVFIYSLPFKLVQISSFPNDIDWYFYEVYNALYYIFNDIIFGSSAIGLWGHFLNSSIILFTISIVFIVYSIQYQKPYLSIVNNIIFSSFLFLTLYIVFENMSKIIYIGWGTYLLLSSALFSIFSIIFALRRINYTDLNNIKEKLISNEFKVFYILIWIIFIIQILLLIFLHV